jgi:hypothetical protein
MDEEPEVPTEDERAALRELCRNKLAMQTLQQRRLDSLRPLVENTKQCRAQIALEVMRSPHKCIQLTDAMFARMRRTASVRRITPAIIDAAFELLLQDGPDPQEEEEEEEEGAAKRKRRRGAPSSAADQLLQRVVTAVRTVRTEHRDALQLIEKLPCTVKAELAAPGTPQALQALSKLQAAQADIAQRKAAALEARRILAGAREAAEVHVKAFLERRRKRSGGGEKLGVNLSMPDAAAAEPFWVELVQTKAAPLLGAKEFAGMARAVIADRAAGRAPTSAEFLEGLKDALLEALQQRGADAPVVWRVKAVRQRGRKAGGPQPGGASSDEEEEEEEEEEEDY